MRLKKLPPTFYIKVVLAFSIVAITYVGITYVIRSTRADSAQSAKGADGVLLNEDGKVEVADALATVYVDKLFEFPLSDRNGNQVSQLKYQITSAELRDEIIIQGKKANSVEGRQFLIVNLKITNDFDRGVEINSRDYIRLTVNGNNDEKKAATIHNDPVEVQAISTKETRLGFTINEEDTNVVLHVGEISGDKTEVPLNF